MPHKDKQAAYKYCRDRRARLVAEGRCGTCGKPTDAGPRCSVCQRKNAAHVQTFKRKLPGLGRCYECGKPLPEHRQGQSRCGWCREARYRESLGWK